MLGNLKDPMMEEFFLVILRLAFGESTVLLNAPLEGSCGGGAFYL